MKPKFKPIGSGALVEVLDVDLAAGPLSDDVFASIYDQYLKTGGIVFRNQSALGPDEYVAFCSRFGELIAGELPSLSFHSKYEETAVAQADDSRYAHLNNPYIFVISNVEENGKPIGLAKAGLYWHSDQYYTVRPSRATSLFGIEIPASGGDTLFINMYQVYDALPESLREQLKELRIEHSYNDAWSQLYPTRAPLSDEDKIKTPDVNHQLVQQHRESGRTLLYLGAMYQQGRPGIRLIGAPGGQATALLDQLRDFVLDDRFVYRHKWATGDILISDNRCVMHSATPFDETNERRVLYRTTGLGDITGQVTMATPDQSRGEH